MTEIKDCLIQIESNLKEIKWKCSGFNLIEFFYPILIDIEEMSGSNKHWHDFGRKLRDIIEKANSSDLI